MNYSHYKLPDGRKVLRYPPCGSREHRAMRCCGGRSGLYCKEKKIYVSFECASCKPIEVPKRAKPETVVDTTVREEQLELSLAQTGSTNQEQS